MHKKHDDEFRPNEDRFDIEGTSQDLEEPAKEVDKKYWRGSEYWLELHEQMIPAEHFTGPRRSMNRTEKCEYLESEIKDIEDQHKEFLEKETRLSENDKKLIGETMTLETELYKFYINGIMGGSWDGARWSECSFDTDD